MVAASRAERDVRITSRSTTRKMTAKVTGCRPFRGALPGPDEPNLVIEFLFALRWVSLTKSRRGHRTVPLSLFRSLSAAARLAVRAATIVVAVVATAAPSASPAPPGVAVGRIKHRQEGPLTVV